jgi:Ca2+-binding RTX toxin-like protein
MKQLATTMAVVGTLALALFAGAALAVTLIGGPGDDYLEGTADSDTLDGRGGDDTINGRGGGDTLYGRTGQDFLFGAPGPDVIYAGPDFGNMYGERGADRLIGSPEHDMLSAGIGGDHLRARQGDDSISLIADGDRDVVACGEGFDSVTYYNADESGIDTLRDCEDVTLVP